MACFLQAGRPAKRLREAHLPQGPSGFAKGLPFAWGLCGGGAPAADPEGFVGGGADGACGVG